MKKEDRPNKKFSFVLNSPNQKSFNSHLRVEKIILFYNILY